MTIKSKVGKATLGSGFIMATTIAGTELANVIGVGVPIIVVPLGVVGGAIGARQLFKELKEESKRMKLKKVV